MVLIRFIDLFTFSHGGNWNQQWGRVTLMWIVALVDFDVLERYSDVGYMNSFLLKGHD